MEAYIEIWSDAGAQLVPLEDSRATIGRSSSNDIRLPEDQQVSRLHAVLERYPAGWCVRDVGSSNGTYVNGERLLSEHRLRTGDEVRLGGTRVVFREREAEQSELTLSAGDEPPDVTRRERDVLLALCRPIVNASSFAQPATIKEMAADLVVSEAAIKFHLSNLYDKFGIYETGLSRRAELANEAVRRGAVTVAELRRHGRPPPSQPGGTDPASSDPKSGRRAPPTEPGTGSGEALRARLPRRAQGGRRPAPGGSPEGEDPG